MSFSRRVTLHWCTSAALALLLGACGGDDTVDVTTTSAATLSGDQEVPPTTTGAIGSGTLALTTPPNTVTGSITFNGMTATAAHVHQGELGVNGPVIVPLTESAPGSGVWNVPAGSTLTAAQAAALANGDLYFNAHSTEFPGGEIRGQIGRDVHAAQLSGALEVPANGSAARGTGLVAVDPANRRVKARLTVTGMATTAAHIHSGVLGVNGPIIVPLVETTAGSNIWVAAADATLTEAQLTALNAGGLYFNAHSAAFPGGEIRGQIGLNVRTATLNSAQEVPPNPSLASGSGRLVVDPRSRAASGGITITGMTATAAHVHIGAAGVNGPVIIPLTDAGGGNWTVPANALLSAEQFKAYKQGNLYFNAHSTAFPGGEIRGQIR